MLFIQDDLVEELDKMKGYWIAEMRKKSGWWVYHKIMLNLSMIDRFKLDRKLMNVSVDHHYRDKIPYVAVRLPVQSFIGSWSSKYVVTATQSFKPKKPMKALRCSDASIIPMTSADWEVYDHYILFLEYQFTQDPTLEEVPQCSRALKKMVESDLEAIEYNTNLLMEEVRDWMDTNIREILEVLDEERLKVQTDPLEALASTLATDMGIIRSQSKPLKISQSEAERLEAKRLEAEQLKELTEMLADDTEDLQD